MGDFIFLMLNASVVWCVITAVLMYLLRMKSLVLALIISPYVIGSTFRNVAGVDTLLDGYATTLIYGFLGILIAMIYMEYQKAKAFFKKAYKTSYIARIGIVFSSLYLLSYFARKIIFDNPMVEFALGFINGGDTARELASKMDTDSVSLALGTIAVSFTILGINYFREKHTLSLEQSTNESNET